MERQACAASVLKSARIATGITTCNKWQLGCDFVSYKAQKKGTQPHSDEDDRKGIYYCLEVETKLASCLLITPLVLTATGLFT
jgi:hypothetical protein